MADTLAMTIHVSSETRELVRDRIADEPYVSDEQIIADGFDPFGEDDEPTEWEREEIIAAHNELNADPSSGLTVDQVQAQLAVWRRERLKAG